MSDFSFELVGFDLDGTLLDTSGDLAAAVNHALQLAGREPLTVAQIRPKIGGGAKNMLRMALDDSGGCDEEACAGGVSSGSIQVPLPALASSA